MELWEGADELGAESWWTKARWEIAGGPDPVSVRGRLRVEPGGRVPGWPGGWLR